MIKKSAYTLIELLVVIVIIVLLLAFGIPAFNRYGKTGAFDQKVTEIKELAKRVKLLSERTESSDVESYTLKYSNLENNSRLYIEKNYYATVETPDPTPVLDTEIKITDQIMQCAPSVGTNNCPTLTCYTDRSKPCFLDDLGREPFSLYDASIANRENFAIFNFGGVKKSSDPLATPGSLFDVLVELKNF